MADNVEILIRLNSINSRLERGDKRELARRLGVVASRISDAFDGLSKDEGFLARVENEAENLLEEREAVKQFLAEKRNQM